MKEIVCFLALSCLGVVLARDQTSFCRFVTPQTCNEFGKCCARRCSGPNQSTCSESSGGVSQASCTCSVSGGSGIGSGGISSGGGGTGHDQTNICLLTAEKNCDKFNQCCKSRCQGTPASLKCKKSGLIHRNISEASCMCASSPSIGGMGSGGSGHRPGHGSSGSIGSIGSGGSGGIGGSGAEEDFGHTCARNYHNCNDFRNCCTNRCAGRSMDTQCQESFGRLKNTVCKCRGRSG